METAEPMPFKIRKDGFSYGVGVGAVVMNKNHPGCVLVGKRINTVGEGTWAFPGGHIDFGESVENCTRRECAEEVNLKVTDVNYWTMNNCCDPPTKYHYLTIFMTCWADAEPENLEPHKCEKWEWVPWDQPGKFPEKLFAPLRELRLTGFSPFASQGEAKCAPPLFEGSSTKGS